LARQIGKKKKGGLQWSSTGEKGKKKKGGWMVESHCTREIERLTPTTLRIRSGKA